MANAANATRIADRLNTVLANRLDQVNQGASKMPGISRAGATLNKEAAQSFGPGNKGQGVVV
jgi:hypothetical protein